MTYDLIHIFAKLELALKIQIKAQLLSSSSKSYYLLLKKNGLRNKSKNKDSNILKFSIDNLTFFSMLSPLLLHFSIFLKLLNFYQTCIRCFKNVKCFVNRTCVVSKAQQHNFHYLKTFENVIVFFIEIRNFFFLAD